MDSRHREASEAQIREIARLFSVVEGERRYFQELAANIPAALAVFDTASVLAWSNHAFRSMYGDEQKRLADVLPTASLRRAAQGILEGSRQPHAEQVAAPNGRDLRIHLRTNPNFSETEVLVLVEDLSSPLNAARNEMEAHYAPLEAITWELDASRMEFLRVDRSVAERLGLDGELWSTGRSFWARRFSTDEMARVRAIYQAAQPSAPGDAPLLCDYRTTDAAGRTRWLRDHAALTEGHINGVTLDITRETEQNQMEERAARIAAQRAMASAVAHDNNNLLMILRGYGEDLSHSLAADTPEDSPIRAAIHEIVSATDRLAANTKSMAEYTAKQPPVVLQPFSLSSYLSSSHAIICGGLALGADLVVDATGADAVIESDPQRLADVLATLVASLRGSVRIHAAKSAGALRLSLQSLSGQSVPSNVFEINPKAGTELGPELHAAYEFFRASNTGVVVAESGYDLLFPLATQPAAPVLASPAEPATQPTATGTPILVVDDEDAIRGLLRKVLERAGYHVIEANSAEAAIDAASRHEGPLPLLVSDVVMPGMGGVELAQHLSLRRPEIRTLLISGFTGESVLANVRLPHGFEFLQKPFALPDLLAKVRKLVGE